MELVGLNHPGPDNYNAAPTETIVVLRLGDDGDAQLVPMRWWLIPSWSKEPTTKYSMFNAKSETVERSAAFKKPFRSRRCVVPVSGFYEWTHNGGRKLPYHFVPHDDPGLLLAGIWDRWHDDAAGRAIESFAVLTCPANPGLQFVHNRQPVMLSRGEARQWIAATADPAGLKALCGPHLPMPLDAVPVSSYVNNARHKDARCVEPVGPVVAVAAGGAP